MNRLLQVILAIFLGFLLLGLLPVWPYSTAWGYYPSGGIGLLLFIILILILVDALGSGRRGPV